MKTHDTTGQLVMYSDEFGTRVVIGRDLGFYAGSLPKYNCRRLKRLHTLRLTITHPLVEDILAAHADECYGCNRANTSSLCPITDAEAESLVSAAEEAKAQRKVSPTEL